MFQGILLLTQPWAGQSYGQQNLFHRDDKLFIPVRNMLQPTMGKKKILVLEMNLKALFRWNKLYMSCAAILPGQLQPEELSNPSHCCLLPSKVRLCDA